MTIEEIFKKRGIEYKPIPTSIQQTTSTKNIVAQIKARQEVKKERERFEGMFAEGERLHKEAVEASNWKRILKETVKGIPDAIPKTLKTLATPEGIRAAGRGSVKGYTFGWLQPKTLKEANEIEKAIESGWELAGHLGAFMTVESALLTAFKTPTIASVLGKSAPKVAFISSWLGTSQLHEELRGADFEERAKRAYWDAVTILAFGGLGYGIGKGIKEIKRAGVIKGTARKAINSYSKDIVRQLESPGYSKKAAKIIKGLNFSKVKTLEEANKLVRKSLTPEMLRMPSVEMTLQNFYKSRKLIEKAYIQEFLKSLSTKGKPLVKKGVAQPMGKLVEKLKPTKFEPGFKPMEKPIDFKITPKVELKALERISKDFPEDKNLAQRIEKLKGVEPISKEFEEEAKILRGTRGMTADDIMKKYPNIRLKRDVPAKDIHGNKVEIPEGEKLTPYELKGNKVLLQDGETYIVSKNQFQNIKGQSVVAEGKPFAPELEGLEEIIKIGDREKAKRLKNKAFADFDAGKITTEERNRQLDKLSDIGKFSDYQFLGGKDYREILFKSPTDKSFTSAHSLWDDDTKGLGGWIRMNFKRKYKGKDVGFLEETQDVMSETHHIKEAKKFINKNFGSREKFNIARIKRALQEAVNNKSDYFAWINGEQTIARYNLGIFVEKIGWKKMRTSNDIGINISPIDKSKGMSFFMTVDKKTGIIKFAPTISPEWKGKRLDEALGKGLADKIMAKESGTLSGEGLDIGGEWATNLYDKQIKNIVEKLTGQKVEILDMKLPINDLEEKIGIWVISNKVKPSASITDSLKNARLTLKNLKVGIEINRSQYGEKGESYIITDVLGKGKFKAIPKKEVGLAFEPGGGGLNCLKTDGQGNLIPLKNWQETFDISVKTTKQQGIKLTTEVKNKIKGIAPKIKTSGKMFETVKEAVPTIKPTAKKYSEWLKKQPEAVKEFKDIQAKITKIKDIKVKKAFVKTEKLKFETKYSEKFYKALPRMKITKTRNLAFNPKNLLKPIKKTIKQETDKIVKRSEIAKMLSEKLNVPIRRGKFRQRALGIYKGKERIIRIKKGGLNTITHEAGHHIDKVLGLSKSISKDEMKELTTEYAQIPLKRMNMISKKKEAMAEFIRFYVTEPAKAQKKAPVFSSYFEEVMKKFPEIKETLLESRRDYKRWLEMPNVAKVESHISETQKEKGLKEKTFKNMEELYISVKDDLYPIKIFQNTALKLLKNLPSWEMPYLLARLTRGWMGKAETFFEKGTLNKVYWTDKLKLEIKGESLREILKPITRKKAIRDFNNYLVNLRVLELSKQGIGTGIAKEHAFGALKELSAKYPEFKEVAKKIYKFQDEVLSYGYQSHLFSKELLAKFKAKNKFYIPFYRVLEETVARGGLGKGYANISSPIKRMKGSELDIVNPLESVVKNTYAIINASERNSVNVAMANLAGKHYELGRMFEPVAAPMAKVATVDKKNFSKGLMTDFEKVFGFKTQEVEGVIDIFRPSMFLPNNVLTALINGKKHYFQVDPMIYKSLMALDRETTNIVIKFLSKPTHWLRAGAILTPEFMIRNPMRDLLGAFVYSKYGFYTPIDFVKGIFSLVKQDDKYWLWRASGGEHAMYVSMDRRYLQKSLKEVTKGKEFKDYAKNPLEMLRTFSEFSETPTRLGEFRKGLAKMDDPLKAAYASREITLDFAKMGNAGQAMNNLIVFSNAHFESWDKLIRTFKNHPTRTTTRVFLGITLPSILLYLNNRKDPRWKEIPQWQKDLSWIFFMKNPDDMGWDKMSMEEKKEALKLTNSIKHGIIRYPKPFQLGLLFGSIPERVLEYIDNDDPEVINQLAESLLKSTLPNLHPTFLQPFTENQFNYDFFLERPIVPLSKGGLPPEAQYTAYTSEVAKILGKTINYSPIKIENLFTGYFGGLGQHSINVVDEILKGTGIVDKIDPEMQMADKAIVKAFLIRRPIGSSSESVNRFYKKYKKYEGKEKLWKQYYINNEVEKLNEYKRKNPEIYMRYDWERKIYYSEPARFYRKVAARISKLRKIEEQIYASKKLDALEKRVKLTDIDKEITRLARKAIEFDIRK